MRVTQPKFVKTLKRLSQLGKFDPTPILRKYGERGVAALASATPLDTGETAQSWSYTIKRSGDRYSLIWMNSVMAGTAPLVILLQYGHATKSGYFLSGRDFINPALRPVYDALEADLIAEVTS